VEHAFHVLAILLSVVTPFNAIVVLCCTIAMWRFFSTYINEKESAVRKQHPLDIFPIGKTNQCQIIPKLN
jgi:hypothetical protein